MDDDHHHRFPSLRRPKSLSKQSFRVCYFWRRKFRLRASEPPEDVKSLFKSYSDNGTMSVDHLVQFLREYQGEINTTREDAQAIFGSLRHFNIFHHRGLHVEAFFRYLLSDMNSVHSSKVHHDMDSPLAHYYLYTGHNSYLTGNQLTSYSSIGPIISALKRGVRVIELDLWPSQTREEDIDVRHGGTLTSSVELLTCLGAIREHAFIASEYPVVITFEDHLTPDLRAKVALMVIRTFGEMLFCPDSELVELPSPEMLKGKILISTKPPKEYELNASRKEERAVSENDGEHEPETDEKEELDESQYQQEEDTELVEYGDLISIHAGKRKGGIDYWFLDDPNKARRLSLSEVELDNAIKTHGTDIIRFTQRNLLRVYPKGSRVDSSNYNPLVGWTHGAQMVAFNMQGYGKYLWIMQGMFRANGGCGLVKKPDFLLNPDDIFHPHMEILVKTTLKVKVYMGDGWHLDFRHDHFDLYSPPDFYTRVGIAGVPLDTIMTKTRAIEDQWFPMWNQEFDFPLRVPELALLRIEVMEFDTTGKHEFAGQICLPVSELRTGIRSVPLHDRKGEKYRSVKLLIGFEFL